MKGMKCTTEEKSEEQRMKPQRWDMKENKWKPTHWCTSHTTCTAILTTRWLLFSVNLQYDYAKTWRGRKSTQTLLNMAAYVDGMLCMTLWINTASLGMPLFVPMFFDQFHIIIIITAFGQSWENDSFVWSVLCMIWQKYSNEKTGVESMSCTWDQTMMCQTKTYFVNFTACSESLFWKKWNQRYHDRIISVTYDFNETKS